MYINLAQTRNSSLLQPVVFDLENFTIFAGENNAGKSHLLRSLKKDLEGRGIHVIYIPAEKVVAEKELDTGTQKDYMRTVISDLVQVAFDVSTGIQNPLSDIATVLPTEFNKFGIPNTTLAIDTNNPSNDEFLKSIKDIYAKKLIDSVTTGDGYSGVNGVPLSSVGQGTQRLIVASLIQYISNKQRGSNERLVIIFEEPEVFLHPKLKIQLHKNLSDISASVGVVISTHDPFFIQLGTNSGHKIYKVSRNGPGGATKVEEAKKKLLQYDSYAEINYQIFDVPSETYFLELYEHAKREYEARYNSGDYIKYPAYDEKIALLHFEPLGIVRTEDDDHTPPNKILKISRLRHNIAHGKNSGTPPIGLAGGVSQLINFIETRLV